MWRPDGKHADCETVNLLNRRVTAGQTETSRCQFICLSIQLCNSPLTPRGWTGCTLTTYSNLEQILKQVMSAGAAVDHPESFGFIVL